MSESALYTVVVDGGGTGCRVAAFNTGGHLVATVRHGPASLSLGPEQAWQHIEAGLQALAVTLEMPSGWRPSHLVCGLAGASRAERCMHFQSLLPVGMRCTLVTDGVGQLYGATGGSPGICLAIGTGSVVHWLNGAGTRGMAGGWGFPSGDSASGAWLGRRLLGRYLWHRDRRLPASAGTLFARLEARIGSSVSQLQQWSTCTDQTVLASLAPLVVVLADLQDPDALALREQGASECLRLIDCAPPSLPVCLAGGLANFYHPLIAAALGERLRAPRGDALYGLYQLATGSVCAV